MKLDLSNPPSTPDLLGMDADTLVRLKDDVFSDPHEDLAANLAWTSSRNGAIGTGASFSLSTLSVGVHTITAEVRDSVGLPGQAQIRLTVHRNKPPAVTITEPGDGTSVLAGTPVIASDSPGLREAVRHERSGLLVPHGDRAALVSAMDRFLSEGSLREELERGALGFAGEFSWEPAGEAMTLRIGDQVKTSSSSSAELRYFDGTRTTIPEGNYVMIAVRQNGGWRIRMLTWNDDPRKWIQVPVD